MPTAKFANSGPVAQGSPATVYFVDVVGLLGPEEVFFFSYDFNNDGVYEVVNSFLSSITVPASLTTNGQVVRGRVRDRLDRVAEFTTTLSVTGPPPPPPLKLSEPILLTPVNAAVDVSLTPTFTWTGQINATKYRILMSNVLTDLPTPGTISPPNSVIPINVTSNNPTIVLPQPLLPNKTYYWMVRSGNATDGSPWSQRFSFTTAGAAIPRFGIDAAPNPVTLGQPMKFKVVGLSPTPDLATTPEAFIILPSTVGVNQPMQLGAALTFGGAPNRINGFRFLWSFGDGQTSTQRNPIHTYTNTGTFTISVAVTDENNTIGSDSKTLTVPAMLTSLATGEPCVCE